MVERGETDLSLARFTRLTGFLGISVADLLEGRSGADSAAGCSPSRWRRRVDRGDGVDYRVIHREHPQLVAVTLAPGAGVRRYRARTGARTSGSWVEGRATFIYGAGRYSAGVRAISSASPASSPTAWRTRPSYPVFADRRLQRVLLVMTGVVSRILAGAAPVAPKALVRPFAMRYIAGPALDDALATIRRLSGAGRTATVDVLGEQLSGPGPD